GFSKIGPAHMPIATDVSPDMVRGLAVIAGAGPVYRFGTFYGRSRESPAVAAATVDAGAAWAGAPLACPKGRGRRASRPHPSRTAAPPRRCARLRRCGSLLEHDAEKWIPVFG